MDGVGGYYAEWNKSEKEILYDTAYMWILKKKKIEKKNSKYNKKEANSQM